MLQIKYRPISFSQVIGQPVAVNIAKASLRQAKIQSTFLLVGSSGSGKTTLARIIARALNCPYRNEELEPCNQCESCQAHLKGTHLAITEIDGADRNGVDDVREIIENCKLHTIDSPYRVYIIDETHMMSKSAQNAMLKLLEEPPANTVFLLCTTEEDKLLETIRSRARILRFRAVDKNLVTGFLLAVAEWEKIPLTPEEAHRIYEYHHGSIRKCLQTLGTVSQDVSVAHLCPQIPLEEIQSILLAFDNRDYLAINTILQRVTDNGFYPRDLLLALVDTIIDIMALPDTVTNFIANANRILEVLIPAINKLGSSSNAIANCRLTLYHAATVWQSSASQDLPTEIKSTLATQTIDYQTVSQNQVVYQPQPQPETNQVAPQLANWVSK
ncbi:MAG: polymerase gamma and tau subunit [Cyanobacteriota bacterium]